MPLRSTNQIMLEYYEMFHHLLLKQFLIYYLKCHFKYYLQQIEFM